MPKPTIKEMFAQMNNNNTDNDESAAESGAESDAEPQLIEVTAKPSSQKGKKRPAKSSTTSATKKKAMNLDPTQVVVRDFQPRRTQDIQFKHTIGEILVLFLFYSALLIVKNQFNDIR